MNDTPRTNAQTGYALTVEGINKNESLYADEKGPFVLVDFARDLERENERLRDIITRASVNFFCDGSDGHAATVHLSVIKAS